MNFLFVAVIMRACLEEITFYFLSVSLFFPSLYFSATKITASFAFPESTKYKILRPKAAFDKNISRSKTQHLLFYFIKTVQVKPENNVMKSRRRKKKDFSQTSFKSFLEENLNFLFALTFSMKA